NLRGVVLPVIDLRTRLDLPAIERNERQRIVVFNIDGVKTGFIVDLVTEVLKLAKDQIESTPKLTEAQNGLLSRMANLNLEGRMIQLLDAEHLMVNEELQQIRDMSVE
ncbi:MAG: chemotaxis protein CheW, partial [Oceanobacter sp.]